MTTHGDAQSFDNLSLSGLARSAIGSAITVGNDGFSITSQAYGFTLAANESSAANVAKVLATVIRSLQHRGILPATFS